MSNQEDREAAKALIALAGRLLTNDIDFAQYVEAIWRVLDQPEKPPRFYQ
jgi:hypothetical protein